VSDSAQIACALAEELRPLNRGLVRPARFFAAMKIAGAQGALANPRWCNQIRVDQI
jgi:hypothetical protein